MCWNTVSYESHSDFIWIFKFAISFKFRNKKNDRTKSFIASDKIFWSSLFFFFLLNHQSLVFSFRERRRNRAIENSSASARQRRWPRVESIWTTFSLARWPCNCPVASAGAPQSSLYRIPLSTYLSRPPVLRRFFFIAHERFRSFRVLSARRFFSSRRRATKIPYARTGLSSQRYTLIVKSLTRKIHTLCIRRVEGNLI